MLLGVADVLLLFLGALKAAGHGRIEVAASIADGAFMIFRTARNKAAHIMRSFWFHLIIGPFSDTMILGQ